MDVVTKMTFYFLKQENSIFKISIINIELKYTNLGYFIYSSFFFPRPETPHIHTKNEFQHFNICSVNISSLTTSHSFKFVLLGNHVSQDLSLFLPPSKSISQDSIFFKLPALWYSYSLIFYVCFSLSSHLFM